jgi:acyl-CoA thioesterase-2
MLARMRGAAVDETLAALALRRDGDQLIGALPGVDGRNVVFGGLVIAQAIAAAVSDPPPQRRLHSLHAYFLRRVVPTEPLSYRVATLREGRTLESRRLDAVQDGKQVLTMTCSFATDGDAYEYQASLPADALRPEDVEPTDEWGPWLMARLGPTEAGPGGFRSSTSRMWFRTKERLPDDAGVLAAFVGFASDITWTGGRPLHLEGDTRGMVSVDHAIWFHRPLRTDEWTYYDVHSIVNTAGRGLLRGSMYSSDGRLCASVAQEMILRRYEDA